MKNIIISIIGIGIGIGGLGLTYFLDLLPEPPSLPEPTQQEIQEQVEKKIIEINSKLSFLQMKRAGEIIRIGGKEPTLQYSIDFQDSISGLHFFKKQKYSELELKDPTRPPSDEICRILDEIKVLENPILTSLKEININSGFSFLDALTIEGNNLEKVLFEFIFALYEVQDIEANKIEILIRGYADNSNSGWKDPLLPSPYEYKTITIKPVIPEDRDRHTYYAYQIKDSIQVIGNYFSNEKLPNLRAQYIKDEFISRQCPQKKKNIEIIILEGKAFKNRNNPHLRKVDVNINLYFN